MDPENLSDWRRGAHFKKKIPGFVISPWEVPLATRDSKGLGNNQIPSPELKTDQLPAPLSTLG
jgi:hypothetical protein